MDESLSLEPPSFSEPDRKRYELWTIRMPISVPVEGLDKIEYNKNGTTKFEVSGAVYELRTGHAVENESFRILSCQESSLVSSRRPFARHLNVVQSLDTLADTELAPLVENKEAGKVLRRAYQEVPQKIGMKRRWMPPGIKLDISAEKSRGQFSSKSPGTKKERETPPRKKRKTPRTSTTKEEAAKKEVPSIDCQNMDLGEDEALVDESLVVEKEVVPVEVKTEIGQEENGSKRTKDSKKAKKEKKKEEKRAKKEKKRRKKDKLATG